MLHFCKISKYNYMFRLKNITRLFFRTLSFYSHLRSSQYCFDLVIRSYFTHVEPEICTLTIYFVSICESVGNGECSIKKLEGKHWFSMLRCIALFNKGAYRFWWRSSANRKTRMFAKVKTNITSGRCVLIHLADIAHTRTRRRFSMFIQEAFNFPLCLRASKQFIAFLLFSLRKNLPSSLADESHDKASSIINR